MQNFMLYLLVFLVFQTSAKIFEIFRKNPIFRIFSKISKNFPGNQKNQISQKIEHKILHIFAFYTFGLTSLTKKLWRFRYSDHSIFR